MKKQTTIYIVRHGESTFNKKAKVSGHADPPLTAKGRQQALSTKLELDGVHFDAAYSSDLQRAIATGEIIYGKPIPAAHQISGLRERNFGSMDGQPEEQLKEGNERKRNMPHEESWVFKHAPDIESDHELTLRFIPALEAVARDNLGKTILVVAHGGAIRTTLMKVKGLTTADMPSGSFGNAGYAELAYTDSGFKVMKIMGVRI